MKPKRAAESAAYLSTELSPFFRMLYIFPISDICRHARVTCKSFAHLRHRKNLESERVAL